MAEFQYKRQPALPVKIRDISPERHFRVRVQGTVLDVSDGLIVVDDGTGKAEIRAEQDVLTAAQPGDAVRVFARVLPLELGYELHAEIVQDISALDLGLHRMVFG